MGPLTCVTLSVLSGCLWVAVAVDDCPYKECDCDYMKIDCGTKSLTSIPAVTGPSDQWTVLDLSYVGASLVTSSIPQTNNITTIPAWQLPPNMTDINFSTNPITTIDAYAFNESRDTLESLSFSEARFTRIPDAFLHLRALKSLIITDTSIQDWNVEALKNIALTLETLHLINVTLHTWPTWMQYFSHLTELNLQSNYISTIPDKALDMLNNSLYILVFNRNNLTAVPKTLSQLTSLQSLDLGYNKISNLTWLPPSKRLGELSLMYNKLNDARHISDLLRPLADVLANVDLFGNQLTEIPDLSFMKNVGYLDLTNNHISSAISGALSGEVTDVDLDFNMLPAIPNMYLTLPHINTISVSSNLVRQLRGTDIPVWILELDLGYNLITELTDTSFPVNSSVSTLTLMGNPIVSISSLAFQNAEHLSVLNLKSSKITRLPLAVKTLTNLNYFDVTDCSDLVCTCMEKSLTTWILNRELPIEGNCGLTSIYNFFYTFIQYCPN